MRIDEYFSLRFLGYGFMKALIKEEKLSLIWNEFNEPSFLDEAKSWFLKDMQLIYD